MLLITDSLSLTWSVLHFKGEKKKNRGIPALLLLFIIFEYARHNNKKDYMSFKRKILINNNIFRPFQMLILLSYTA